jgi:hypothetical protein
VLIILVGFLLIDIFSNDTIRRYISIKIVFTFIFSTLGFIVPFFVNLIENFLTYTSLGIGSKSEITLLRYMKFLLFNGADSLVRPIEGSALLMYIPLAFYFIIIFSLIHYKKFSIKIDNDVIRLLMIALFLISIPVIIYSISSIRNFFPTYLRIQLNLIPLMILLIAVILASKLHKKKIIIFGGVAGLIFEYLFWVVLGVYDLKESGFESLSNSFLPFYIPEKIFRFSEIQIALNILNICLLYLCFFDVKSRRNIFHYQILLFLFAAIFNVVFIIGQKFYVNYWNGVYVNSQPIEDFETRWKSWGEKINLSDLNQRFIPTGLALDGSPGTGSNYKTLMDTELNRQIGYSTLFQYREFYPASEYFYYSIISGRDFSSHDGSIIKDAHFMPPSISNVVNNSNFIDFLGIDFLISADGYLTNEQFKLIDTFRIDHKHTPLVDQNGVIHLYQNQNAGPIAFSTKILDSKRVIDCDKKEMNRNKYVFDYNYVTLDTGFFRFCTIEDIDPIQKIPGKIIFQSPNEISIQIYNNNINDTLFTSITNRRFFQAKVNGSKVSIQDSMMGLMAIPLQKGYNELIIKYIPYDVYFAYLISFLFLGRLVFHRKSLNDKIL